MKLELLIIFLSICFFLTSCKKGEDVVVDPWQMCSTCDKYILKNNWVATSPCSSGGLISVKSGSIELNNADLSFRKRYYCHWHSNDAPLGGFSSESKDLTYQESGKFIYAQDSSFIRFDNSSGNATLIPAHWSPVYNTDDSVYVSAKLKYFESFNIGGCHVMGFFEYSIED
jgi:hypothetical protein